MSRGKNALLITGAIVAALGIAGTAGIQAGLFDAPAEVFPWQPAKPLPPVDVTVETALTKDEIITGTDTSVLSGVFSQNAPYRASELDSYETIAGGKPNVIATFAKWDSEFRADAADLAYARGALPLFSWEPWATGSHIHDPAYSHANIIAGTYDEYITRYAQAVADYKKPVMIRFAHEMNGGWYPWGVNVGSNTKTSYADMWRHVHSKFTAVGADNAIWVWAPNTIRAIPDARVPLAGLYPGDDFVDMAGMTAYSTKEASAEELFEPTTAVIRSFTSKKILIAEMGALSHSGKTSFIASLFDYVARADIAGYVWFETDRNTGGNAYWRIEDYQVNIDTYRAGMARTAFTPVTKTVVVQVPAGKEYSLTPLDLRIIGG